LFHVISPGQRVIINTDLGIDEVIPDDGENARKVEAHAKEYLTSTYVPVLDEKQIPYQVEIVSFSTDNDSIGSIICKRAEQVNASAVIMAKHTKGMIKEFIVGSATNYCESLHACSFIDTHDAVLPSCWF